MEFRGTPMLRQLLLAVLGIVVVPALAGCTSLGSLAMPAPARGVAVVQPIVVASARKLEPDGSYGSGRSAELSYAAYEIRIPPSRRPGMVARSSIGKPNPSTEFSIVREEQLDGARSFQRAVVTQAAERYNGPAEVFVYVHGFNTSFEDSLFQLAQVGNDLEIPATKVLFAWPSEDELFAYIHDLDSVAFARDALERALEQLANSGVKRIVLVGYSMGAALVVETLRQMKLSGSPRFFGKLGGVVLLSPDMDVELFRVEAARMGTLPRPFVIYGSRDDTALNIFANLLTKDKPRLGALPDPRLLEGLDLTYIDVRNVSRTPQIGHLVVATSPSMIAAINDMPKADLVLYAQSAKAGKIPGASVERFGSMTSVVLPKQ